MEASETYRSEAESEAFTWGSNAQEETIYVTYQMGESNPQLPYNPFAFDLRLTVYRSKANYEEEGIAFDLSRQKTTVFCRRKKKEKPWTDKKSSPVYLSAETISEHHFNITNQYLLNDLGSRHGTYYWVGRHNPRPIGLKQQFLVGKHPLVITVFITHPRPFIEFTYQDNTHRVSDPTRLYLIGSHKSCDLIVPSLYQFQVCINPAAPSIWSPLDEEEASSEHGLWLKLPAFSKNPPRVENGDLILAEPYILRVSS